MHLANHKRASFAFLFLAALVSGGCVATPPKSQLVSHDAILGRQGGVLLMVDACVQRDQFGGVESDYFVITEAEAGAQAALGALQKYVQDSSIPIRAQVVSVCAARLNTNRASIRVADKVGSPVREAQQPIRVTTSLPVDSSFENAVSVVSTYAFERAAVVKATSKALAGGTAPAAISLEDFQQAARLIKQRTQASSVLFLGVLGVSRSGGKATAQIVGTFAVAMGTAFATAGLGTGFYLVFVPGRQMDGMVLEGALIDLDSGDLTWSNAVRSGGDPVHPKVMANPQTLDLLFHDIMFKPASAQPSASTSR